MASPVNQTRLTAHQPLPEVQKNITYIQVDHIRESLSDIEGPKEKAISSRTSTIMVLKNVKASIRDFFKGLGLSIKEKFITLFELTRKTDEVKSKILPSEIPPSEIPPSEISRKESERLEKKVDVLQASIAPTVRKEALKISFNEAEKLLTDPDSYLFLKIEKQDQTEPSFFLAAKDKKGEISFKEFDLKNPDDLGKIKKIQKFGRKAKVDGEARSVSEERSKVELNLIKENIPIHRNKVDVAKIKEELPPNSYIIRPSRSGLFPWTINARLEGSETFLEQGLTSKNILGFIEFLKTHNMNAYEPIAEYKKIDKVAHETL